MTGFTEISAAQFARLAATPAAPLRFDVRLPDDIAADPYILLKAILCYRQDVAAMVALARGPSCVVYCQTGLEISPGVAGRLRSRGSGRKRVKAVNLPGAMRVCLKWACPLGLEPMRGSRGTSP